MYMPLLLLAHLREPLTVPVPQGAPPIIELLILCLKVGPIVVPLALTILSAIQAFTCWLDWSTK